MNVLKKILKEIDDHAIEFEAFGSCDDYVSVGWVKEIIRYHMNNTFDVDFSGKRLIDAGALEEEVRNFFLAITGNPKQATVVRECKESIRRIIDEQPTVHTEGSGWIPVSEKLPEPLTLVLVTVHTSEWIADYDSDWVPEEKKTYHPERYNTRTGYRNQEGDWIFFDKTGSEVWCVKEFGSEKGVHYSVVTAWQPLTEPYKGG